MPAAQLKSAASMKKESRAALLVSKRAIDAAGASNREELLRTSAVREKQDLNEQVAYVLQAHSRITYTQ